MNAQRFEIGGVMLTPEEIRQARSVLEAAAGNHVRGPLQRAGHPLAHAPERGWYQRVTQEHLVRFPLLRVEPGTIHDHVAHVKPVTIHYLGWLLEA
jgi:hypothetical protein